LLKPVGTVADPSALVLCLVRPIDPSFDRDDDYSAWYRHQLPVVLGVAAPDRFLVNVGEIYWFVAKDQFTRNYGDAVVVATCYLL